MAVSASRPRKGQSKGTRSGRRRGQRPWWEDREAMVRVRFVMRPSVINQPVPLLTEMLNVMLEQRGLSKVTERTVYNDINRALELYRERIIGGVEWYRAQFQAQLADTLLDIEATPRGKDRAPLRAEARRFLEDMARIDGLWAQVPGETAAEAVFEGEFTSAQELLEQGEIGQQELEVYLSVLHRETGGIGARGLPVREVIDAEPAPAASSAPARLRGRDRLTSNQPPPDPGRDAVAGARTDEEDDVVDWTPED